MYFISKSVNLIPSPVSRSAIPCRDASVRILARAGTSLTLKLSIISRELNLLFILIDVRLKPQKIDLENINYLGKNNVPLNLIFTKCDKVKKEELKINVDSFINQILDSWEVVPKYFITYSTKRVGIDDILSQISETINSITKK